MDRDPENYDLLAPEPARSAIRPEPSMNRDPEDFDLLTDLAALRQMLQNRNPTSEAQLPWYLQKYGELCNEANQRLRKCHGLTLRGQYTNAVAFAEREPNLLQRCSELEIPEREILPSVAEVLGIKAPTPVDHGLIQSLQDAYEKGSSSAANLRLLHKLTLARAPLPTRLHMMRRLLIQDPNHPFMDADIRTFERAWFKQAPDFAKALARQARPELIQEILQDFSEAGYMETPPPSVIAQIETILGRVRMALLPALAASIHKAYAERSLVALTPLADRWNNLVDEAGPPTTALDAEVGEALAWVRQELGIDRAEAERDDARAQLSFLIQSHNAKRFQLDMAYDNAMSLGGIDTDLDKLYLAKLEDMDHRFKMKAVGITIAAVVALCLFMIVATLAAHPSTVDATESTSKTKAIDEDSHVDTDRKEVERVEAERKAAFARKMKEVEESRAEDAHARFDEARKLTRTAEELKALQLRIEVIERQVRLALNEKTGKLLQTANDLLIDARRLRVPDGRRRDVDDLRGRAVELGKESSRLNSGANDLRRIETTLAEVEAWRSLARKLASLRDELKGARGTPRTLERLAGFLTNEVAPVAPDSELALRAGLSHKTLVTWVKALELQDLLRTGDFQRMTTAFKDWKGPVSESLAPAAEYVQLLRDRDPNSKETITSTLRARLRETDIKGLWMVRPYRGNIERIYYTRQSSFNGGGPVYCLMEANSIEIPVQFPDGCVAERAPQTIFAERIESLWGERESGRWEARLAEVYDTLLANPKMEPLLKLELAQRLLDLAGNTSFGFREILGEQRALMEIMSPRALALRGNWLNPGQNKDLEESRTEAGKLLANSPRLVQLVADVKVRGERRLADIKRALTLAGWICRDNDGRPALTAFDGAATVPGSRLYAAAEEEWLEVGSISADGKEFRISEAARPLFGWPIFAIASPR